MCDKLHAYSVIRGFGLVGNYRAKAKASESWRRDIENQLGVWESCVGGSDEIPESVWCFIVYIAVKWINKA